MAFKKQPSLWPKGYLITARILQLFSALIVLGITSFFTYHLVKEELGLPYEFIGLELISCLSILNGLLTLTLFLRRTLSPTLVLVSDLLLTLTWGGAFGTLARAMGSTIVEKCSPDSFGEFTIVCHLYKILLAFSGAGWVLHLASCLLAFRVRRRGRRHAYAPAGGSGIGSGSGTSYGPIDGGDGGHKGAPPVYRDEVNGAGGKGESAAYYGS